MGSKLENNKCCDAVNASVLKCYGMGTSAVTSKWKLYLCVAGYLGNSPREILWTHIRTTNLFNIGSENFKWFIEVASCSHKIWAESGVYLCCVRPVS